jgi:hypothetical protein
MAITEIDYRRELITPEVATKYVEANTNNRPLVQSTIDALVRAIKQGEWLCTHQGIAFSPEGRLLDGQHRLWAIIEAGVACELMVARNVPEETFAYLDVGRKRTLSDRLNIERRLAEALSVVARLVFNSFTAEQARIVWEVCAPAHEYVTEGKTTSKRGVTNAPIRVGALARILSGTDKDWVRNGYRALVVQDYAAMSPVLQSFNAQLMGSKLSGKDTYSMICRAYLAFAHPGNITRLMVRDSESLMREIRSIFVARITQHVGVGELQGAIRGRLANRSAVAKGAQ